MAVSGAILSAITAIAGAAASVYGTISSNRQAEKSAQRQAEYQKQLAAEEAATEAEQKRITQEAIDRSNAYGASLLAGNTALNNNLSGNYQDEQLGSSILSSSLGSGVSSLFS